MLTKAFSGGILAGRLKRGAGTDKRPPKKLWKKKKFFLTKPFGCANIQKLPPRGWPRDVP